MARIVWWSISILAVVMMAPWYLAQGQEIDLTEKVSVEFFTEERIKSFQGVEVNLPAENSDPTPYLTREQIQKQEQQQENLEEMQRRKRWEEGIGIVTKNIQETMEILR